MTYIWLVWYIICIYFLFFFFTFTFIYVCFGIFHQICFYLYFFLHMCVSLCIFLLCTLLSLSYLCVLQLGNFTYNTHIMATFFCMGIDLEVKWNKTENLAGLLYYTECIFSLSKNFCMTDCLGVNWNTSTSVKCHKKKGWLLRNPVSLSQNAWKHDSGWPASIQKYKNEDLVSSN